MTKNITMVSVPSAYITKSKLRIKQYDNNTVYLKNGDEFEVELFNPTQDKILAKIEINGKSIGNTGIVIRPGERVWLERYIDDAKKFLFETYNVSWTNSEVRKAIESNGDIVVNFYQEQPTITVNNLNIPSYGHYYYYDSGRYTYPPYTVTCTSNSSIGTVTTDSCCNVSSSTIDTTKKNPLLRGKLSKQTLDTPKEIETGRIEKGNYSNQNFTYDYSKFNCYSTWSSRWKILPLSQKEMVIEDLQVFCTECGGKRKKDTHKFCPLCGTKY